MNLEVENAITELRDKASSSKNADEALKFSQAALNLAHTANTLVGVSIGKLELKKAR